MNRERRRFINRMLGATAGLAVTGLVGRPLRVLASPCFSYGSAAEGNPLRFPGQFSGTGITAAIITQEVWPGEQIPVWTMGGSYPAPTIRVRRGDRFAVKFTNELPEESIIHWHGFVIPHDMDGHPMDAVGTGGVYDYSFEILNRAGTYWYHPHPHGRTGPQVYMGMAGFFIVSDEEEESLGLPTGPFDIPLMIQDRNTTGGRRMDYVPIAIDHINGKLGNEVLVNGTPDAVLEVSADLYRVRILNGSNARVLNLGFANGKKFYIIGTDGGLLDRPYEVEKVFLGPAERLELLVDFSGNTVGETLEFRSLPFFNSSAFEQQGFTMPVMRFVVARAQSSPAIIPERLTTIERLDPTQAVRTQQFTLTTRPGPPHGEVHLINGKQFGMHRIDATAQEGDIEIWEIRNGSHMMHPMHIHGVQFQVLSRTGGTEELSPRDYGWKDSIIVWREETVRVIMRFGPYAGTYLIHCHNLEHEDSGMMLNYDVIEEASAVEEGRALPTRLDLR